MTRYFRSYSITKTSSPAQITPADATVLTGVVGGSASSKELVGFIVQRYQCSWQTYFVSLSSTKAIVVGVSDYIDIQLTTGSTSTTGASVEELRLADRLTTYSDHECAGDARSRHQGRACSG
jgi:hypothetical protein